MLDNPTIDQRREALALITPSKRKSALGQFMTPTSIANFMTEMFSPLRSKEICLLDPGAGIGSLTAAFTQRAVREKCRSLLCEAWELDDLLKGPLLDTLQGCAALAKGAGIKFEAEVQNGDFIVDYSSLFAFRNIVNPAHAILNPPYKKISSVSAHRRALRKFDVETTNLYSAFVSLALKSLRSGGELVAITPRSFCNGTYFRPFREYLLGQSAVIRVHLFESRTHAFKSDSVLQENVIFHLIKGRSQGAIALSTSTDATFFDVKERVIEFSEFIVPNDAEKIFHLAITVNSPEAVASMNKYCNTLDDIGLGVSTGPVVDFRLRAQLQFVPEQDSAPLIYAHHFAKGFIEHPKLDAKKPNYIAVNNETRKWMMPGGFYVAVRRLSSKEERRRIVPAVFDPAKVIGGVIGFENHLNIFHFSKGGMPADIAKGLAIYLGSSFADRWLRRFSGHTQVNAGDLRAMRYPDLKTLEMWGKLVKSALPTQEEIDAIVDVGT